MDKLPKCLLLYLLSYCHDSYKSLRVVCKRFILLVPMPKHYVKYNEYKILQPKKMILDENSGRNYPNSLEKIDVNFDSDNIVSFDFSHLTNLREINGQALGRGNFLVKVPDNLKVFKCCRNCDLSNTKLEKLECYDRETLETAPITLKKLVTDKLYPFCNKFVNLESLYLYYDYANGFDYTCFTKLKRISINLIKSYKLPLSVEYISIYCLCEMDFTYLPNLKVVRAANCRKNVIVNAGVEII